MPFPRASRLRPIYYNTETRADSCEATLLEESYEIADSRWRAENGH
jgi:hypothetical protein